jgi:multisubunit Na+/H+ antiporter MnhG subunit
MTTPSIVEAVLLATVVTSCWVGVIGMWKMRTPVQALHYLGLPATAGAAALVAAIFVKTGNSQTAWKMVLIWVIMLATNSIVAHATARAFRARELGHWEPKDGDPMQWVHPREKSREG